MCGVIGLVYDRHRPDLGRISGELLKILEYRGYDSTGAAIQDGSEVVLKKAVGAPSVVVEKLQITRMSGQVMCGQVRWATFGAVDEHNAQPHDVRCKLHIYGAHNGNVTNCDDLKVWLGAEGHQVLSDNDGEMVVHTVEHAFALEIGKLSENHANDPGRRRVAMRAAIAEASKRLLGSFAAIIVDPLTRVVWAIKRGSSLYFGVGHDDGPFMIASSDLSSVLWLTRFVVPLVAGEMVEYDARSFQIYRLADGERVERAPVRSRLRARDTALMPPFTSFMEQEIAAQEDTCREVVDLFCGGSVASRGLAPLFEAMPRASRDQILKGFESLRDARDNDTLAKSWASLVDSPHVQSLLGDVASPRGREELRSSEAAVLADLTKLARNDNDRRAVHLLDALLEHADASEFREDVSQFSSRCAEAMARGGRIFVLCCGSSYHAAKAGAVFFNEIAHLEIVPVLPGEFRGQYESSLRDGDLLVAVSQSGETKDLIDVVNQVIDTGLDIARVAIVNNLSSTLAQEKADLVIPLRCGPEIAVPATKSFMNQLTVFYGLALAVAERRLEDPRGVDRARRGEALAARRREFERLPALINDTLLATEAEIEHAASMLYLCPSMHILATRVTAIAEEGALKIREVVLNHTEGFEASEFKHGPNTILGVSTIYGIRELETLLHHLTDAYERIGAQDLDAATARSRIRALGEAIRSPLPSPCRDEPTTVFDRSGLWNALRADYPLVYVTGPAARDVALTVSQINTHKIRGSMSVVIAEESSALRQAAEKPPADNPHYRSVYVALPPTNDTLMTMFSATVVLQRLALRMSLLKARHLDRLGLHGHGVHPDVPKNVSKSITVD